MYFRFSNFLRKKLPYWVHRILKHTPYRLYKLHKYLFQIALVVIDDLPAIFSYSRFHFFLFDFLFSILCIYIIYARRYYYFCTIFIKNHKICFNRIFDLSLNLHRIIERVHENKILLRFDWIIYWGSISLK